MGKRGQAATAPVSVAADAQFSRWGNAGKPQPALTGGGVGPEFNGWGNAGKPQQQEPKVRAAEEFRHGQGFGSCRGAPRFESTDSTRPRRLRISASGTIT